MLIEEGLIEVVEDDGEEVGEVHNDENQNGDAVDDPQRFGGVDLGIDDAEETVHLDYPKCVDQMQPLSRAVRQEEAD